jgi:hypothetical protein
MLNVAGKDAALLFETVGKIGVTGRNLPAEHASEAMCFFYLTAMKRFSPEVRAELERRERLIEPDLLKELKEYLGEWHTGSSVMMDLIAKMYEGGESA